MLFRRKIEKVEYNNAYMAKAMSGATGAVRTYNKDMLDKDGGNGWSIATGGYVSDIYGSESIPAGCQPVPQLHGGCR